MDFPLLIGILFSFVAIIPYHCTAIKCFKCDSESNCGGYYNFKNDSQTKDARYTDEGCIFNPAYIPACKYVINKELVVRERGCGGVGVTNRVSFCTNRFKDVIICYCTTDWCNGIDSSNSAENAAREHFIRQAEVDTAAIDNEVKTNAARSITATAIWIALITILNSICG